MESKIQAKFRFRSNKSNTFYTPKQQPSKRQEVSDSEESMGQKKGFSLEYINLTKMFKINIIGDSSSKKGLNTTKKQQQNHQMGAVRVKTDIARSKWSKNKQRFDNLKQMKYHSINLNESVLLIKNRKKKSFFFNELHTKRNNISVDNYSSQKSLIKNEKTVTDHLEEPEIQMVTDPQSLSQIGNLANHSRKLIRIRSCLMQNDINTKQCIKEIKLYVLKEENCSISKLDSCLQNVDKRKELKMLLCFERVILISIVDSFSLKRIDELKLIAVSCLNQILGFWHQIIKQIYEQNLYSFEINNNIDLKMILKEFQQNSLQIKRNIIYLNDYIKSKLALMFDRNNKLYKKIEIVIKMCKQISINRAFYEILTIYATHIQQAYKQHINEMLLFFSTCPSPYILKPNKKTFSLVVDLDETLLHTKFKQKSQMEIIYRPGCQEFLNEVSNYYQIIVFTSSSESYARHVTKNLTNIDYFLFRQHAIRVKTGFIKDLSRIGRNLDHVVMIDDIENNFKLQKQNGIKMNAWTGNQNDRELMKLKKLLIEMAQSHPTTLLDRIAWIKAQLKKKDQNDKISPRVQSAPKINDRGQIKQDQQILNPK